MYHFIVLCQDSIKAVALVPSSPISYISVNTTVSFTFLFANNSDIYKIRSAFPVLCSETAQAEISSCTLTSSQNNVAQTRKPAAPS